MDIQNTLIVVFQLFSPELECLLIEADGVERAVHFGKDKGNVAKGVGGFEVSKLTSSEAILVTLALVLVSKLE